MPIAIPNTVLKGITFLLIGFEKNDTVKTKEDGTLEGNSLWSNSCLGHIVYYSLGHRVLVPPSPGSWVAELWSWSLALGHVEGVSHKGSSRKTLQPVKSRNL